MESSFYETVLSTFMASIKSVGTACTLASLGIYLHQCGFIVGNGKRTLALISQQVTIPLLFFTKILYCNQDWSTDPCPNVTDSLNDAWILLVWPIWVCSSGLVVGYIVTILANVPKHQCNSIMASIAFGNSTGLPITLLTVIHANFGSSSVLGSVDPTLFLSVYLVIYPILQWGLGGMLLAPPSSPTTTDTKKRKQSSLVRKTSSVTETEAESSDDDNNDDGMEMEAGNNTIIGMKRQLSMKSSIRQKLVHNVINCNKMSNEKYQITHRGLECVDASMYISIQENLNRWGKPVYRTARKGSFYGDSDDQIEIDDDNTALEECMNMNMTTRTESGADIGMDMDISEQDVPHQRHHDDNNNTKTTIDESSALLTTTTKTSCDSTKRYSNVSSSKGEGGRGGVVNEENNKEKVLMDTIRLILKRCFQPPVIAALLGLLFASFPILRGILVDIDDRNGTAPFQWFFDGLYEIGQSAVPINMMILGCNLSASYMLEQEQEPSSTSSSSNSNSNSNSNNKFFSNKASLYVVIGKMIVMPIVGVLSTLLLQTVYTVSEEIAGGLYLVLLIVFLCPTANNVMVMVELSSGGSGGGGSKEGMARIIAYQYAVAPIVLSGTVTGSVLRASYIAKTSK
jgi:predicted permease